MSANGIGIEPPAYCVGHVGLDHGVITHGVRVGLNSGDAVVLGEAAAGSQGGDRRGPRVPQRGRDAVAAFGGEGNVGTEGGASEGDGCAGSDTPDGAPRRWASLGDAVGLAHI